MKIILDTLCIGKEIYVEHRRFIPGKRVHLDYFLVTPITKPAELTT